MDKKISWKALIVSVIIALSISYISTLLMKEDMERYIQLKSLPFLLNKNSFSFIWFILIFLMGISFYIIYSVKDEMRLGALKVYAIQLFFMLFWMFLFFNTQLSFFAFLIILVVWIVAVVMIAAFLQINRASAYLQIPYIIWITFIVYLNLGACILNITFL